MRTITIEPLTKSAFAGFGDVVESDGAELIGINQGFADRVNRLADIDILAQGGSVNVSLFSSRARPRPIAIAFHGAENRRFLPRIGCARHANLQSDADRAGDVGGAGPAAGAKRRRSGRAGRRLFAGGELKFQAKTPSSPRGMCASSYQKHSDCGRCVHAIASTAAA